MTGQVYPSSTSVVQGGRIDFHLSTTSAVAVDANLVVTEFLTGREMIRARVRLNPPDRPVTDPSADRRWPVGYALTVPSTWPSGLYAADIQPGAPGEGRALFAVRSRRPGTTARILVSIPFPTFHAYAWAGGGASPYWNEQPDRAHRVSIRRPCNTGPDWEVPILRWLSTSGFAVDYCSGYDLHQGDALVGKYQLLVCIGHDEYWTWEMRDTVERFVAQGGNIAFLTGNTCWWQFRLEDAGCTFACYRDATIDPLSGTDDARVTVEWSSAPVNRPENTLTGVSFRRGAGCWVDGTVMNSATWTVHFADHWVFNGTRIADGMTFGTGTIGYETDAADLTVAADGTPRATGADGTPPSFVVLATADLAHWRDVGQGGSATMGVHRAPGGGTVFNAATTGWGRGLTAPPDPTVEQITRNVLTRLCDRWPSDNWERIGHANGVQSMVACENKLFAADDANRLWTRDTTAQNVPWDHAGHANHVIAIASPREATADQPICLYAISTDHQLWRRPPTVDDTTWTAIGTAPGVVALAASYLGLFAATNTNDLLYLPFSSIETGDPWTRIGHANNVVTMTNLNGRLFCVTTDRTIWTRPPHLHDTPWIPLGVTPGPPAAIAGYAGKLYLATASNELHWRDATP